MKTNQLQRIIRTGRTGHWLNHSKEHCLVGIKGNPEVNRNIDTDVVVAEVRETSRKPDEVSGTHLMVFMVITSWYLYWYARMNISASCNWVASYDMLMATFFHHNFCAFCSMVIL